MTSVLQRKNWFGTLALVSLTALMATTHAQAQDLELGKFSIGTSATDLNGFRLDSTDANPAWVLGARLTDLPGSNSGRAIFDVGRQDSGMRFSFGVQLDWQDETRTGPANSARPLSFGSERSSQAAPYLGLGYVGRISNQFEITLDAGASYLGYDDSNGVSPSIEFDRNGSLYGWSPTVTLSGRVRF